VKEASVKIALETYSSTRSIALTVSGKILEELINEAPNSPRALTCRVGETVQVYSQNLTRSYDLHIVNKFGVAKSNEDLYPKSLEAITNKLVNPWVVVISISLLRMT
jgi:hypothetical protein